MRRQNWVSIRKHCAGLLRRTSSRLFALGEACKQRKSGCSSIWMDKKSRRMRPMAIELRPYQEECVQKVLAAYEWFRSEHNPCKGDRNELIVLPTGGGKTVIFSSVINELNTRYGINALIIAHRDELLNQAA